MRIAAIDIGTNSTHIVIAEALAGGRIEIRDRARDVVQLGRGSFVARRLDPRAVARTVESLGRFAQLARRHDVETILCVATAAVREAENGGRFLRAAREALGFLPRVIPAEEEGRLIQLAVRHALQLDETPSAVLDIGGGSVQMAVGTRDGCTGVASAPLGALRLTETMLRSDPPSREELDALRRFVTEHVTRVVAELALPPRPVVYGSSGAIQALGQVVHWAEAAEPLAQINGYVVSTEALAEQARRLARLSRAEREKVQGLDAPRAEIIVPAAIVLVEVLERIGAPSLTLSDFGVREGLILDYITGQAAEMLDTSADLRVASAIGLARKFGTDLVHARHVTDMALSLFEQLAPVHRLGERERELLVCAGYLHDIGTVVDYDDHARHSAYIITHGRLRGLSGSDVAIVAALARYHGKRRPKKRDAELRLLEKLDRKAVRWLSAILRVAEALDRSHYQLVRTVRVVRRGDVVSLVVGARPDAQLELWAARHRTRGLEKLLGARVRLVVESASPRETRSEQPGTPQPAASEEDAPPRRQRAHAPRVPRSRASSGARRAPPPDA